ncbi:hypothetical protein CSUI_010423 [Cystoisospora suis]|uniref:Transmembrane protein n=1 Tax=Cystoisospora suis TaxID=483139 RepID=A0A2C6KH90_9APIC|nr:hypothetical protein CSUI_010423 [Cystoisospora suis]
MDRTAAAKIRTGAGEGGRTQLPAEAPRGNMNAVEAKESVLELERASDHRVRRSTKKRSPVGERRPERRTGLGRSKVLMAVAALSALLIASVAMRFIVCSQALLSRRVTRRTSSGGTSRKLAGRDGDDVPLLSLDVESDIGTSVSDVSGCSALLTLEDADEILLVLIPPTPTEGDPSEGEGVQSGFWKSFERGLSSRTMHFYAVTFAVLAAALIFAVVTIVMASTVGMASTATGMAGSVLVLSSVGLAIAIYDFWRSIHRERTIGAEDMLGEKQQHSGDADESDSLTPLLY